jgi:hypothetical protein
MASKYVNVSTSNFAMRAFLDVCYPPKKTCDLARTTSLRSAAKSRLFFVPPLPPGDDAKEQMKPAYPEAPIGLSEAAKLMWSELAPTCATTPGRELLLQQLLEALDRIRQAQAAIEAQGGLLTSESTRTRPLIRLESESRSHALKLAALLRLHEQPDELWQAVQQRRHK